MNAYLASAAKKEMLILIIILTFPIISLADQNAGDDRLLVDVQSATSQTTARDIKGAES